jgi:hypothetical protein
MAGAHQEHVEQLVELFFRLQLTGQLLEKRVDSLLRKPAIELVKDGFRHRK